jgi:hypothetical protein
LIMFEQVEVEVDRIVGQLGEIDVSLGLPKP